MEKGVLITPSPGIEISSGKHLSRASGNPIPPGQEFIRGFLETGTDGGHMGQSDDFLNLQGRECHPKFFLPFLKIVRSRSQLGPHYKFIHKRKEMLRVWQFHTQGFKQG